MIQVPRRRLGWRVTAGILAALLSAPARWRTPTETDAGCVSCAPATSRRMFPCATLTSWGYAMSENSCSIVHGRARRRSARLSFRRSLAPAFDLPPLAFFELRYRGPVLRQMIVLFSAPQRGLVHARVQSQHPIGGFRNQATLADVESLRWPTHDLG